MTREHLPFLLESERSSGPAPVECLGRMLPEDEARRSFFQDRLREHLLELAFRQIDGFPGARAKTS